MAEMELAPTSVTLSDCGPDQLQIMFGRRRVGYVCYGEGKPINFLQKQFSGIELSDQERIHIAEKVREEMRTRNAERQQNSDRLAQLTKAGYQEESENDGTQQSGDSGGGG